MAGGPSLTTPCSRGGLSAFPAAPFCLMAAAAALPLAPGFWGLASLLLGLGSYTQTACSVHEHCTC